MSLHNELHSEIAIVGAGIAGLICARELQAMGRDVVVVDKSRGLGGRLATRRLAETHGDHGVCYLKPKGDRFAALIQELVNQDIVTVWTDRLHQLSAQGLTIDAQPQARYVAPEGATAIAKALAKGLKVELNQQIQEIKPRREDLQFSWELRSQNETFRRTADIVILAVPAPQALLLVEGVGNSAFVEQVRAVEFSPCLSAIGVYPEHISELCGVTCVDDEILGWIGFDSTKQRYSQNTSKQSVMIIQSNESFAKAQFDAMDLNSVGQQMCDRAAHVLQMPWIARPELLQLHRWKYAFATNPIESRFLSATTAAPLYCVGDWCGGDRVESAFLSGLAMAEAL